MIPGYIEPKDVRRSFRILLDDIKQRMVITADEEAEEIVRVKCDKYVYLVTDGDLIGAVYGKVAIEGRQCQRAASTAPRQNIASRSSYGREGTSGAMVIIETQCNSKDEATYLRR